jgi:hypothetical protein
MTIIPGGLVFGSLEPSDLTSPPLAYQAIEGHIVAKGVLVWEQRLSPVHELQLRREYLVLQNSHSLNDLIVLEFEPFFISIDQFHLGEKIQAQLASDGSIVSAKHVK